MTDLQQQIELLDVRRIDDELVSVLACEPKTRARHRMLAIKYRRLALDLRHTALRQAEQTLCEPEALEPSRKPSGRRPR